MSTPVLNFGLKLYNTQNYEEIIQLMGRETAVFRKELNKGFSVKLPTGEERNSELSQYTNDRDRMNASTLSGAINIWQQRQEKNELIQLVKILGDYKFEHTELELLRGLYGDHQCFTGIVERAN